MINNDVYIDGSTTFRNQVNCAIGFWLEVDSKDGPKLLGAINKIVQRNDDFKVELDEHGDMYVAENTAFWPGVSEEVQQKLLASYIAHEGVHAGLLKANNEHWNDKAGQPGEMLAIEYQDYIANKLNVPLEYTQHPDKVLAVELKENKYKEINLRRSEELIPIVALAGIAVGVTVVSHMLRRKKKRYAFINRY